MASMKPTSTSQRFDDDCAGVSADEATHGEDDGDDEDESAETNCGNNKSLLHTESDGNLKAKHKVFLSHTGAQKDFVEQLCKDLEARDRYPFYDKRNTSLPIGEPFPELIFKAIEQCQVGVLVLSKEFFMRKWPMVELVAMVKEWKKPESRIKIIPVFYHISQDKWSDLEHRAQWISQWGEWASHDPKINLEEWKEALEILKPITGLVIDNNIGEVNARRRIEDSICNLVQGETSFNVSHMKGRSRLCQVVREKIYQDNIQKKEVRVIGLYGMGGIGKTTICKAMCNEMSKKFNDKVCHIELVSETFLQGLRKVLKRVTNLKPEILDTANTDDCQEKLNRCIVNEPVFLAIDNVTNDDDIIKQAKTYLRTQWSEGSVIIVTSRSLGDLMYLRDDTFNEDDCMEAPELTKDEAMSLFLNHSKSTNNLSASIDMDEQLVSRCLEKCYFSKGTSEDHHYIPLALEVLRDELAQFGYDPQKWNAQLTKIDSFARESNKHPIFSILATSYDSLSRDAQMLFMDVALFLPCEQYQSWHWGCFLKCKLLEWLAMVHSLKVSVLSEELEKLEKKSLLDSTKIGMHDLWLEFCVAEAKAKKIRPGQDQRWMFFEEERDEFHSSWNILKRMRFLNEGWKGLEHVDFEACAHVSVLKVNIQWFVESSKINLDFRGLRYLKSLELKANKFHITCDGFGSLKNLVVLKWWADKASSPCIEDIGSLSKLQILEIKGFEGDQLLDVRKLTALQVLCFAHCDNVMTIQGLNSELSNLRSLCISRCSKLRECPGLGELHALEELDLWGCTKLQRLPCLQQLTKLSHLNISECGLLSEFPALSDSTPLKELRAKSCSGLGHLPPLRKLQKLEVVRCTDLSKVNSLDLGEIPRLKEWTFGWSRALKRVTCSKHLYALTTIDMTLCLSLEEVSDLGNFPNLEKLILQGCAHLVSLRSSVPLPALRVVDLEGCKKLNGLPEHLDGSKDLEVLRLQKSGIVMSEEDITKLKVSCKMLVVFSSSASSKYGDGPYDQASAGLTGSDMETGVRNLRYRSRRLWDPFPREKVTKLIYSNNGSRLQTKGEMNLLALTSSGMHKRWDWKNQATVNASPQLWQPVGGVVMINEINGTIPEEAQPCSMALCNDNDHLLSASGGHVSFYTMLTDKVDQEIILQDLPSTATFLAYYPHDDDILAIGLQDSTIVIRNEWEKQVVCTLKGHRDRSRITGLAFSKFRRVLVSLGADGQLCAWRTDQWVRRQLNFVQYQPDGRVQCTKGIRVQFHHDQVRLLAVCQSQLVVYKIREEDDALELDYLCQWDLQNPFTAAISDATYSCDSQLVYAGFVDGSVGIFDAESFWLRCRLAPPLHKPQGVSRTTYPTTIAANPRRQNQFALGMSDGDVLVVDAGQDTRDEIYESAEGVVYDDSDDGSRMEEQGIAHCGCFPWFFSFFRFSSLKSS